MRGWWLWVRGWRGWSTVGAASVSAALWSLAGPSFGEWPLAVVALVPWMVALWRRPEHGVWVAVASAVCFGLVSSLISDHTLARALRFYFDLPWRRALPAFVAAVWAQALFYVPMGVGLGGLKRIGAPLLPSWLAAALCGEWLFPRVDQAGLGTALIEAPLLPQLAELGGVGLLSSVVLLVNAALGHAWLARGRARRVWLAGLAGGLALLCALGGGLRQRALARIARTPTQNLAALQPGGDLFVSDDVKAAQRAWLKQRTAELAEQGVPLVLWPESSLRMAIPAGQKDAAEWVPPEVTVWFGAAARWPIEERVVRNSVFATDRRSRIVARYDKWGLLPFAEYIPRWAWFLDGILWGRMDPGQGPSWLSFEGHRVGVSICYEDMLGPAMRRHGASERPELLANFTNDRWFDSVRARQRHLRLSRLRAIEAGRFLVRATTTGVTAAIDPVGRVVARVPLGEPAVLRTEVPWLQHRTLYFACGEWAYWGSLGWLGIAAGWGWSRRRRTGVRER